MKRLLFPLLLLTAGCTAGLEDRVTTLETDVAGLKKAVAALQTDVEAVKSLASGQKTISLVEETTEGVHLTLSDGTEHTIKHGKDGQNGQDAIAAGGLLGMRQYNGEYYWTLRGADGTEKWLPDSDTPVHKVSEHTPVIAVDAQGYWTVDGLRAAAKGVQPAQLFSAVTVKTDEVEFTLASGETFVLPRSTAYLRFAEKNLDFTAGLEYDIAFESAGLEFVDVLTNPAQAWNVEVRENSLHITAPKLVDASKPRAFDGMISLIGYDSKGNSMVAGFRAQLTDYTSEKGVFLVCEGPYGGNGTILWFDQSRNWKLYNQQANVNGIAQDFHRAGDSFYLVSQVPGSDKDLLVQYDAHSLMPVKTYNNLSPTATGNPQYFAVEKSGKKAYIQYVDTDLEANSGIRVYDLTTGQFAAADIAGTYGAFGKGADNGGMGGALKGKMIYDPANNRLYAALAKGFVVIDTTTDKVIHVALTAPQGVKDIALLNDKIYAAVTGGFTDPAGYGQSSPEGSGIYIYDTKGYLQDMVEVDEQGSYTFSTATWAPHIGMAASKWDNALYFLAVADPGDFMNEGYVARYDIATGDVDTAWVTPQRYSATYGYLGVSPFTGQLWIPGSPYAAKATARLTGYTLPGKQLIYDTTATLLSGVTTSPAGVYFAQ